MQTHNKDTKSSTNRQLSAASSTKNNYNCETPSLKFTMSSPHFLTSVYVVNQFNQDWNISLLLTYEDMRQLLFLLLFSAHASLVFCQNHKNTSIADAQILPLNKTWCTRQCIDELCPVIDSDYYYFENCNYPLKGGSYFGLTYVQYTYVEDPIVNKTVLRLNKCAPIICITDTTNQKRKFKVSVVSNDYGERDGELTFISDKEFMVYPISDKTARFVLYCSGNVMDIINSIKKAPVRKRERTQ